MAATRAGMMVGAVTHRCADLTAVKELASFTISTYKELDTTFFDR